MRQVLGLQAFIIGVSSYPHLPGASAARTKFDFGMQQLASPALELLNFLTAAAEWQSDAAADTRNICLFYFSGHGVQRKSSDSVLLLEDFGDHRGGMLRNAVDLDTIFHGMAHSSEQPKIAKTQLYFVDACRVEPKKIRAVE